MIGKLFSFTIVIFIFIGGIGWQILGTVEQPDELATEYATCTQPTPANAETCAAQEAQILASVVRIVLHANFQKGQAADFRNNVGHATVMAGRYLVTHNHFFIDLPPFLRPIIKVSLAFPSITPPDRELSTMPRPIPFRW